MWIEVHLNGEKLDRWRIDNMATAVIDGVSWEDNVQAREKIATMYLDHFKNYMQKALDRLSGTVEYYLVFESKMNHEQTLD